MTSLEDIKPTLEDIKPTLEDIKPTLEDIKPTLEDTKPTKTPATLEVSDERFLSECFKHIQRIPTIQIDAVAEACDMVNVGQAVAKLVKLTAKYHIGATATVGESRMVKLNPKAIATGGPATTSDKVTKATTFISKRKSIARIVKSEEKPWSTIPWEAIGKSIGVPATRKGLISVGTMEADSSSELSYCSTTYEGESIPADENGRMFPGVDLSSLPDMGLTCSHLLQVKRARRLGIMVELMAGQTPEQVAKTLASEALLVRAEESRK